MEVKTIAVIGAGMVGRRIAYAAALGGYKTIVEDVSPTMLDQAVAWIEEDLAAALTRGGIGTSERDAALQTLSTANTVEEALRQADLIIETAAEEMETKIELFTIFDKFAKPDAIFASSSASLSITEMAEVTFRAERCIGMRFLDNDPEIGVLELVKGGETSEETIAICSEAGRRMGRRVMVVDESGDSVGGSLEQRIASASDSWAGRE
jgi:3-hydroxybutyryl-CoA dehydrogenase